MTEHEWRDQAAGYAMGSLEADERQRFEAHLAECGACRADVASFREVVGLLAYGAPPASVPANLRERVTAEARRVRPLPRPRRVTPAVAGLAAAASIAAVVGLGALARARSEQRALAALLAAARAELAARDSTIAALLGPELHVVSLSATGQEPSVRVFWNHPRSLFVVTAFNLPPAPAGRVYQLWAIPKDKAPISMGTFTTGADGRSTVVVPVSSAVLEAGFIDFCGLTVEPEGGSPQPTEAPRLLGTWRHSE